MPDLPRTQENRAVFFKALKQGLKVKTFVGTSENEVQLQIWTALIAMLVLQYLQTKSTFDWSLSNLIALLRQQLSVHRDLWAWLNNPYQAPPPLVAAEQFSLELQIGWQDENRGRSKGRNRGNTVGTRIAGDAHASNANRQCQTNLIRVRTPMPRFTPMNAMQRMGDGANLHCTRHAPSAKLTAEKSATLKMVRVR